MKKQPQRLLFIGDSITDVDRDYANQADLGSGYAALIAEKLKDNYPSLMLEVFNRGISGNRIADLNQRVTEDCLALEPTTVSILVGINDTWHNVDGADFGTQQGTAQFKAEYQRFLTTLTNAGVKDIILMEPFLLPVPADRSGWRIDLDPKIQVIRELAVAFQATYLPLDGLLNSVGIQHGFTQYALDGVHPTAKGHQLIANHWFKELAPTRFADG